MIVTGVLPATPDVLTSNVATVLDASSDAVAGTCTAAGLLLDSVAFTPPAGPGVPLNVSVPWAPAPLTSDAWSIVTPVSEAGTTLRVVLCGTEPSRQAEMVTGVGAETPDVKTVNFVRVSPTGTRISPVTGTCTFAIAGLLLEICTNIPPVGFPLRYVLPHRVTHGAGALNSTQPSAC